MEELEKQMNEKLQAKEQAMIDAEKRIGEM